MNALSLILRVVAVLGACAAAYFFFDVKGQLKDSSAKLDAAKKAATEQTAAITTEKNALSDQVGKLETEKRDLEVRLNDEKRRVSDLNTTMVQSRNDLARIQQENRDRQNELTGLQSKYDSMQTELKALRAQGSPDALTARVTELETQNADLAAQLAAAKTTVAKAPTANGAEAAAPAAAEAKDLVIDGTYTVLYSDRGDKHMVLNLGEDNGLKAGMVLSLVRNDKPYGDVVVKSVRPEMTVVYSDKSLLRAGDFVKISAAK